MEDNKDVVETTEAQTGDVPAEKTYTEQDINNSFNAGAKKAMTDWQKSPEYKEYLHWKKTNQDDSEKIAELESNNAKLTSEITTLKAQQRVNESDVKREFSKFVTSEVLSMVDDRTDFETALKSYKKDNPQYFGETVVKKVQTSPNLTSGSQPQTTNSIMNSIIRGNV